MKAKEIAKIVHADLDRCNSDNVSVSVWNWGLKKLRPEVLEALRTNYGFSKVEPEGIFGYVKFERSKAV